MSENETSTVFKKRSTSSSSLIYLGNGLLSLLLFFKLLTSDSLPLALLSDFGILTGLILTLIGTVKLVSSFISNDQAKVTNEE